MEIEIKKIGTFRFFSGGNATRPQTKLSRLVVSDIICNTTNEITNWSGKFREIRNHFFAMAEIVSNRQGNPLLIAPSTNASDVLSNRLLPFMPKDLPTNSKPVLISFPELS